MELQWINVRAAYAFSTVEILLLHVSALEFVTALFDPWYCHNSRYIIPLYNKHFVV